MGNIVARTLSSEGNEGAEDKYSRLISLLSIQTLSGSTKTKSEENKIHAVFINLPSYLEIHTL